MLPRRNLGDTLLSKETLAGDCTSLTEFSQNVLTKIAFAQSIESINQLSDQIALSSCTSLNYLITRSDIMINMIVKAQINSNLCSVLATTKAACLLLRTNRVTDQKIDQITAIIVCK